MFEALSGAPSTDYSHVLRWYKHITSYGNEKVKFPGQKKELSSYGEGSVVNGSAVSDDDDDDDDDMDLFGSEDEEVFKKLSQY